MQDDMDPDAAATLVPNTPDFVGADVMLSVRAMVSTSPPRVLVRVTPPQGRGREHELSIGDTFPIDAETWRFEDVHYIDPDDWTVTVRRVEPGSPPFTPPPLTGNRVWNTVDLYPFGTLDETRLTGLERAIGRSLPPVYRRWLAETNGATPVQDVEIPGLQFALNGNHPLLGVRPDRPSFDLQHVGERNRARWLTDAYIVIAVPIGGLLAVSTDVGDRDVISWLPERDRFTARPPRPDSYRTRAGFLSAERLIPAAPDIYSFCAYLQPMPPARPATLAGKHHTG